MLQYFNGMNPWLTPQYFMLLVGDYHFLTFGWAAIIFLVIFEFVPNLQSGKFVKLITTISKSTFHILLTQMLYFSIIYHFGLTMYDRNPDTLDVFDGAPLNYLWFFPLNVLVTFTIGIYWKKFEDHFYKTYKDKASTLYLYRVVIIVGLLAYITWQLVHFYLALQVLPKIPNGIDNFIEMLENWP